MQKLILELDTKTARFEESVRRATERLDDFVDAAKEAEMYGLCVDASLCDTDSDDDTFGDEFEIGDVVVMRGQDQLMTVEDYCAECDSVDVAWFAGNQNDGWTLHRDTFDGTMLVNISDDDGEA